MRPKIFRMASELKENEEGMSEILRTNDSVLRVMDLYKTKMAGFPKTESSDAGATGDSSASSAKTTESGGPQVQGSSEATPTSSSGQNGAAGGLSDVLIDLADLNFGGSSAAAGGGVGGGLDGLGGGGATAAAGGNTSTDLNSSLGLGSLMDDISALGESLSHRRH